MNNIPPKLRSEMAEDPFMKRCALEDENCAGRIQWHHVLIVAGKQLQKKFAIVGACEDYHHKYADRKDIKERFLHVALNRATFAEILSISKVIDYSRMKKMLNAKFK